MTPSQFALRLADGTNIRLRAEDETASAFLARFARASGLPPAAGGKTARVLEIRSALNAGQVPAEGECLLAPMEGPSAFFCWARGLTMAVGRIVQRRGGTFLHAALAELRGRGVLLAAPGGVGKSTASARLPKPWRSLCDDMTLVIGGRGGRFYAHPWPTLSRFLEGGRVGSWDTPRSVPLAAAYFLIQSPSEQALPVGPGEGLALLIESSEQASRPMARRRSPEESRVFRRERFENLARIARFLPVHRLRLSLKGAFWKEIERTISL